MLVYLKTISPIHIGSGEIWDSLSPFFTKEKINDKEIDRCYFININKLLNSLNNEDVRLFSKWMDEITMSFEIESKNTKKISTIRKDWSIESFLKKYKKLTDSECRSLLTKRENYYYSSYVRSKSQSVRDIVRQVILPDHRPYIPGSSIKGAMRTALAIEIINSMNDDEKIDLFSKIENNIILSDDRRKVIRSIDYAENVLMKYLFCYGPEDKWQHYDFCKFINIADCFGKDAPIELCQVSVLTKEKKDSVIKLRSQEINIFEVIPANIKMRFLLNFNFDKMKIEYNDLKNRGNNSRKFEKIFKYLFGIDFSELINKQNKEFEEILFDKLKNIIDKHSKNIIEDDCNWYNQFGQDSITMVNYLSRLKNQNGLLRVGYASGFLADTIFSIAKAGDISCQKLYKKIFQATALDLPPNMKRGKMGKKRNITENIYNSFPSSRRVITGLPDGGMMPLGWVKISDVEQ